jgi:hypothetical protein
MVHAAGLRLIGLKINGLKINGPEGPPWTPFGQGGGFNINADLEDVRLIRGPLKSPIVYQYDMKKVISGRAGDVELAPGDVVFVTPHWSATMGEVINRITPLLNLMLTGLNTWLLVEQMNLNRDLQRDLRQQIPPAAE